MKETMQLLQVLDELDSTQQEAVLATVVKVEGSAYRRPGARMLIPQIGGSVGTVSGGCLEGDLIKKAWWLTEAGEPVIRTYSTGVANDEADEEEELAFGLGCNGTVHILLERVRGGQTSLPLFLLRQVQVSRVAAVLATVIASSDDSVRLAERAALDPADTLHLAVPQAALARALETDMRSVRQRQRAAWQRYRLAGGEVEVLFEYLAPPRRLVVFGAGHDAQPLVSLAQQQGWQVAVVDSRSHFARRIRFPEASQVLNLGIDQVHDLAALLESAAVVIMSHSYSQDRYWLEQALRLQPSYIGQLGPRSRTERLLDEIGPISRHFPAYERLHYPMGLDIGGDAPESVALSVLAEITAHFNERVGGMLRAREAAIHDSVPALHG
ncbi:xanthine dehydrogenase [Stutzerimonas stutzeri]|uniref:Xanthine dehydrogenase n=1 Tax=Stutzerimonas stutzeri TaxID=316 RepID=A0A2N8SXL5_STUST|nr:XdhC/CoxI family protein [Stutzerimonas stutzeri]MCQ4325574.1 XdhC family protein [Stutzerimonas stutzeri]PNG07229.1 xanthine dehydrogenase [Stutzerimonas stutzeri]